MWHAQTGTAEGRARDHYGGIARRIRARSTTAFDHSAASASAAASATRTRKCQLRGSGDLQQLFVRVHDLLANNDANSDANNDANNDANDVFRKRFSNSF